MREIKFRGKRKDNGEWVYGVVVQGNFFTFIVTRIKTINKNLFTDLVYHEVDPETVGQFTGLLDKNGREVFEGDVCSFKFEWQDRVEEVIFMGGSFALGWCISLRQSQIDEHKEVRSTIEIIGNIYENPDLLQQK